MSKKTRTSADVAADLARKREALGKQKTIAAEAERDAQTLEQAIARASIEVDDGDASAKRRLDRLEVDHEVALKCVRTALLKINLLASDIATLERELTDVQYAEEMAHLEKQSAKLRHAAEKCDAFFEGPVREALLELLTAFREVPNHTSMRPINMVEQAAAGWLCVLDPIHMVKMREIGLAPHIAGGHVTFAFHADRLAVRSVRAWKEAKAIA